MGVTVSGGFVAKTGLEYVCDGECSLFWVLLDFLDFSFCSSLFSFRDSSSWAGGVFLLLFLCCDWFW